MQAAAAGHRSSRWIILRLGREKSCSLLSWPGRPCPLGILASPLAAQQAAGAPPPIEARYLQSVPPAPPPPERATSHPSRRPSRRCRRPSRTSAQPRRRPIIRATPATRRNPPGSMWRASAIRRPARARSSTRRAFVRLSCTCRKDDPPVPRHELPADHDPPLLPGADESGNLGGRPEAQGGQAA